MPVDIGPRIGIDGEAEYRRQLNNIIQQSRTLASEMRAVTSAFDDGDRSEEALAAQTEVLNRQIENQRQRLEQLQYGLSRATDLYGEADSRTQRWQQAVNNATTEMNRMERQLDNLSTAADDAADSISDMDDTTSTFSDMLSAGAIIEGVKSIVSTISDISESAMEYRNIMASLEVSSNAAGYTAEQTADTFSKLYGVLGDEQATATTIANLQAIGLSQGDLTRLTEGAIGAWARYGDSIPIDSLSEAINETIQTGTVTGAFADVLNWAGTSEDAFNEALQGANTSAERANIVLQELSRQGLMEAGAAWQQNNADIVATNQATNEMNESFARISEMATPVIAELKSAVADLLSGILDMIENKDPWLSVIIGAATAFGTLAVALNIGKMIDSVKTSILALNAALSANPIALVVAAIAGLVAAIVYLWNTNEGFRNFVISAFNTIKQAALDLANAIKNFFTVTIPGAFNTAKNKAIEIKNNIMTTFNNLKNGIRNTVSNIKNAIVSGIGEAIEFIKGLPAKAVGWGKDFINGLADGIIDAAKGLVEKVKNIAGDIASFLHFSRPDRGPLRDYESWMPDMIDGMVAGIEANAHRLQNAVAGMAGGMTLNTAGAIGQAGGGNQFSIVVNPAPGMDEEQLANLVMQKMEHMVRQREGVWA